MIKLNIPQMSCGHCVGVITKTLKDLDQDAMVQCDLATHQVQVTMEENIEVILGALSDAGYAATVSL